MNTENATSAASEVAMRTANTLINDKKLSAAAALLDGVAESVQTDPRYHLLRTNLAEALGQAQEALASAYMAVEKAPAWPPAVLHLALLLARQNQFSQAIVQAKKVVSMAPDDSVVLHKAIEIAHRAQQLPLAVKWLTRVIQLEPHNRDSQRLLANDLSTLGEIDKAIALLDILLETDDGDTKARQTRAHAYQAAGKLEKALQDWNKLLVHQPGNVTWQYYRELALGHTPPTQPTQMVGELFDGLANRFDAHLVKNLQYRLPQHVAALLIEWHPDRNFSLLDLGCGTGLLGEFLGPINGDMVGIDVSSKMLEQAARHGVYDQLHHVAILDMLESASNNCYQSVAALDVFIYVGILEQIIPQIHRILTPGGRLVFSCERAGENENNVVLRPSGRYAHRQTHINALCQKAGFMRTEIQEIDVRLEGGTPVKGFLVVAQKYENPT